MRSSLILALLCSFAPLATAKVWSVDPGGASDFTTIQPAIDAAAEGDIILVTAGVYLLQTAIITGKSLTMVAAPAGASVSCSGLAVTGLTAQQRVVIRGIDVYDSFPGLDAATGMQVTNCLGTVWIEDCRIDGRAGHAIFNQTFPGEEALRVLGSHLVTAVRCDFTGGKGYESFPFPGPSGDGSVLLSGTASFWDCTITGGSGGTGPGDGLRVDAGKLMFSGSHVSGGGAGAIGLDVTAAGITVETLDSTFSSTQAPAGTISSWPAVSRSLELTSPVIQGTNVDVVMRGLPADQVFIFWSLTGSQAQIGGTQGWYILGPPTGPFFLWTITTPNGQQTLSVIAPPLVSATLGGFTFLVQPYHVNTGEIIAGASSAFVLLK